ncbi:hypothetical protein GH714_008349 [Hevea brasiliensis]|uniref:Protein kinase domain-containing protein n=1 Tax=Hevea brasiliensis TaxID=3981 RepID=A0A6A6MZH3_HEVBR|nr:hypothetical protein GH714_008349 [Hevea brasiliensis]
MADHLNFFSDNNDLYVLLKMLQREIEIIDILVEYLKDETKDLKLRHFSSLGVIMCFYFFHKEKNEGPKATKCVSAHSISTSMSMSTDRDVKRSGSECDSHNVSDFSSESSAKNSFARFVSKTNFSIMDSGQIGYLQVHKEWVTEVNVLVVVEHLNLVKLLGYCAEDDERGIQCLLIYEYMSNKSMQDHLPSGFHTPLPFAARVKIAQDAARGLAYLHEGMDFQIIFRDFKSFNILLDDQWNAKLSDFGLARLGPSDGLSHVSTAAVVLSGAKPEG